MNPGAEDVCDNGVDEDCDGADLVCPSDVEEISDTGCRCAAGAGSPTTVLGMLLLLLVGTGRRRRSA